MYLMWGDLMYFLICGFIMTCIFLAAVNEYTNFTRILKFLPLPINPFLILQSTVFQSTVLTVCWVLASYIPPITILHLLDSFFILNIHHYFFCVINQCFGWCPFHKERCHLNLLHIYHSSKCVEDLMSWKCLNAVNIKWKMQSFLYIFILTQLIWLTYGFDCI